MRLLTLLCILLFPCCLQAQTIFGKVIDADENKPIAGASIYLIGTYQGTNSDASGHFELHTTEKKIPLVVSCVGYSSVSIDNYSGKNLNVVLKRKTKVLREVTIGYQDMSREDEMKIFMREFIGNNHKCVIKNADDINFKYHKKESELEAFAEQPLIIENKDLGYTITYFLEKFDYKRHDMSFTGNYFFREDTAGLKHGVIAKVLKERNEAYFGSRMHFIRALWLNALDSQNFTVLMNGGVPNYNELVAEDNGEKYLKYASQLKVIYGNNNQSTLQQNNSFGLIFIGKNGFYDNRILWDGFLAVQRVGDLLPFEFQPVKR